jgi:hypothetical protein
MTGEPMIEATSSAMGVFANAFALVVWLVFFII